MRLVGWFLFVYLRSFFYAVLLIGGCAVLATPFIIEAHGLPVVAWSIVWKLAAVSGLLALFLSMPAKWFEEKADT